MLTTPAPPRFAPDDDHAPAPVVATTAPAAPLRVVTDAELRDARRRLRARRAFVGLGALVVLGLFGVVIAHVMLMQGQFELERLQTRSAAEQADYDRLRLQVSELESPDRVVAVAQQKLGMVAPPTITYLAPASDPASQPSASSVPPAATRADAAAAGLRDDWSSVKSHLDEG